MNFLIFFLLFNVSWSRTPISGSLYEQLSGVKGSNDSKTKWDQRYSRTSFIYGKSPAKFLAENYEYLPLEGNVLDLGMGEGRNAVFLAQKGFKVTGIDISSVAVKKSQLLAQEFGVKIKGIVASVKDYKFPDESFDAIICFYYVDRSLIENIKKWLKPGGVIIFEAHNLPQRSKPEFKKEPEDQFLKNQELLKIFGNYRILKFEEPIHEKEFRSSIIVKKE